MRRLNQSRLFGLKGWIIKLREKTASAYNISPEKLGFELTEAIESMTEKQIHTLNCIIASAYHLGADSTRDHFREMRQDRHNPPVFARRSQFKLVQGGAA